MSRKGNVERRLVRCVGWLLEGLLGAGVALSGLIVLESRRPEPGADMVLMGLPVLAAPMLILAIVLLGITSMFEQHLSPFERTLFYATIIFAGLPFAALFILG